MALSKFNSLVRVAGQLHTITYMLDDYSKWINSAPVGDKGATPEIDDPRFTEFLQHLARVLTRASVTVQDAACVHAGGKMPEDPRF